MIVIRNVKKESKKMNEPIAIKNLGRDGIGFAVDLGTTTIAMTGILLCDGSSLGECSQVNVQTQLGSDVMMRIMHAIRGKEKELQQMVVQQIESMAENILRKAGRKNEQNIIFTVVGNTTMSHLFLGRDVKGLAGAPFVGDYAGNYQCKGKEVGMNLFSNASILVLSNIQAHVGGDALAVIGALALGKEKKKRQLAIDLGTNAEIILNDQGKLSVCSTAAGPAFEGKGVDCGMTAKAGAINGVRIAVQNGNMILEVLESDHPKGICGTGLVDLLAQLRKSKVLREDGYLISKEEALAEGISEQIAKQLVIKNQENIFILTRQGQKEIYLSQSDIRNLQLAKGAIQAGVRTLLQTCNLSLTQVDEIVITGVLGSCMKVSNALEIGLFPDVEKEKLHFVKNAAGTGAAQLLLNTEIAKEWEQKAKEIHHVELAKIDSFQKALFTSMTFQKWEV